MSNSSETIGKNCRKYSIEEILAATDNFNGSLVIGRGGFGQVYKGKIDNRTVAIKSHFSSTSSDGLKDFHREIAMVSNLNHPNIISLIGYCETRESLILLYEYMDGGTLEESLCKVIGVPLLWVERLKISICVAEALVYLHTSDSRNTKVIHRDIKDTNILLDKNRISAKISDFGASRKGPANQPDTRVLTRVMGSDGYIDPAYSRSSLISGKTDVYAFGTVLFQLMSGRNAYDTKMDQVNQQSLGSWAQKCVQEGRIDRLIDPNLRLPVTHPSLSQFVKIANSCLDERLGERPTMKKVLSELKLALQKAQGDSTSGTSVSAVISNDGDKHSWLDESGAKCYKFRAKYLTIAHSNNINKAQWISERGSSFDEMVELKIVYYLEIKGNINTTLLSPNVLYGAYLLYKLRDGNVGYESNRRQKVKFAGRKAEPGLKNFLNDGQQREDEWMELELGEYMKTKEGKNVRMELIEIDTSYPKKGLVIEGIEVRRKVRG